MVVGAGNNGGDGTVLARHARQAGRTVAVIALPGKPPATSLAQRAASEFTSDGGTLTDFDGALPEADIWVDALFGLGFDRAPEGVAQALIAALNAQAAPVLALDVPSGVDADRGAVPGEAVKAALTLQFIVPHRGLYTGDALDHCGRKALAPLQLPTAAWQGVSPAVEHWTRRACRHCCRRAAPTATRANPGTCCASAATMAAAVPSPWRPRPRCVPAPDC